MNPSVISPTEMNWNKVAAGQPTQYAPGLTPPSVLGADTSAQPAADPFSQWGGQANYNALRSGYSAQKSGIDSSVTGAEDSAANSYKGNILDFLDSLRQGQRAVDNKGVQAELAKRQGMDSVTQNVGDNIRSGGVVLANRNASTSSASDALARAYAMLGTRAAQQVGTQYGTAMDDVNQSQQSLNDSVATQGRHNEENKTSIVTNLVNDAASKLSALDAQIAGASLPDRINIEAEKTRIRQEALGKLSSLDPTFSQGVAGIAPTGQGDRVAKASQLATSGVSATTPFNFSTEAPGQFQGTGGFASDLPLFTLPRKNVA